MKTYEDYYTTETLEALRRKRNTAAVFLALLAAASVTACVILLCRVNTLNAPRMLTAVLTVNAASCILWLLLYFHLFSPLHKEHDHVRALAGETRERLTGTLHVLPGKTLILTSITVRDISLEEGPERHRLLASARVAPRLARLEGRHVTVETVHRYVVATEVES